MHVSLETLGTLERRLTVRIPADRYENRVRERIRELGQTVRLKGFRPGKVPAKVIEQRFGAQVRNEAMSDVVGSSFQEAVKQENLRPAVAPSIKANPDAGAGDIEYVATFEVVPEIGAVDVGGLEITRPVAQVDDRDIDVMIETLRAQRKQWSPVDRGAAAGDMALFEYSAQTADGRHPETGMERVGTIVGSGALSPALEEKLVGLKAGESAQFELAFPANFRQPALAGKSGQVALNVIRVQEGKLPDVDEAFVHAFGIREGGIERFRQDVRANLERELHNALRARTKTEVVEKLVRANASLEVPKGMVGVESQAMLREGQVRAERMGYEAPTSAAWRTSSPASPRPTRSRRRSWRCTPATPS